MGGVLALQALVQSFLSSFGGLLADELEKRTNHGRILTMKIGISVGAFSILMIGVGSHLLFKDKSIPLSLVSIIFYTIMRLLYALSLSMILPVMDGITLVYLQLEGKDKSYFGKERLYGAITWALAHIIMGPALDLWGFKAIYSFAFISWILCLLVFQLYAYGVDELINANSLGETIPLKSGQIKNHECEQTNEKDERIHEQDIDSSKNNMITIITAMFGTIYGIGFIFSKFTLNMGTSVVEQLIFLFFNYLGSSNTMCGLTVAVTVMFEIPIFEYAPEMLKRFGLGILLQISSLAYIVRVVGYSIIPKQYPALVLLLEPLHGVTYACSKASGVEFAARYSPKGYEASGQGILTIFSGAGNCLGVLLGGILEDKFGSRIMYRCFATIVTIGAAFFGFAQLKTKREI